MFETGRGSHSNAHASVNSIQNTPSHAEFAVAVSFRTIREGSRLYCVLRRMNTKVSSAFGRIRARLRASVYARVLIEQPQMKPMLRVRHAFDP